MAGSAEVGLGEEASVDGAGSIAAWPNAEAELRFAATSTMAFKGLPMERSAGVRFSTKIRTK
jgi:hypothetical protein